MKARAWSIVAVVFALAAVVLICDPLNQLVLRLSCSEFTSGDMWKNGFFSVVDLPPTASAREVVLKYFGGAHKVEILETKKIWIAMSQGEYWAARVTEDGKPQNLILEYCVRPSVLRPGSSGYWSVKLIN